jgi:hypothetical protein
MIDVCSAMLARCHFEADKAQMRAESAHSPEHRREFQFMQMRWLMLARNYEDVADSRDGVQKVPF